MSDGSYFLTLRYGQKVKLHFDTSGRATIRLNELTIDADDLAQQVAKVRRQLPRDDDDELNEPITNEPSMMSSFDDADLAAVEIMAKGLADACKVVKQHGFNDDQAFAIVMDFCK